MRPQLDLGLARCLARIAEGGILLYASRKVVFLCSVVT